MTVNGKAWLGLIGLVAVMALLLFVSAGTLQYWQAWVYLATFGAASLLITLYLMRYDPALLERRTKSGPTAETRGAQKIIMLATSVGFIALLVVPALDHRFGWSAMAPAVVWVGDGLVLAGFGLIARVYRENSFTSATIEVAADQRVISTGPYAVIRHPMYAGGALYLIGTPLALGSYRGLAVLGVILPFLVWRLVDEERFLAASLSGYEQYREKVRHRIVPFVW